MPASSITEYIDAQPAAVRRRLRAIRGEVKKAVPEAEGSISYGIPAFSVNGKRFFYMAAWKEHIAVYPVTSGSDAFKRSVEKYRGSKSALHFMHDEPLPLTLIGRVVRVCLKRYAVKQRAR
ncbi:MAG: DUF1801 domain-containing protein [Bacteroidetes bacterium]|nr:DUF1801 domain-containing protein [Bacteroidota bacterium]